MLSYPRIRYNNHPTEFMHAIMMSSSSAVHGPLQMPGAMTWVHLLKHMLGVRERDQGSCSYAILFQSMGTQLRTTVAKLLDHISN